MNKTRTMSTETKHLLEGRNNYIHIRLRKDLFARYLVIVTMIVTLTETWVALVRNGIKQKKKSASQFIIPFDQHVY